MDPRGTQQAYRLRSDVRYRLVGGEAVVLRQEDAEVVILNEVGSRMLDLVAGEASLEAVRESLLEEFEVDAAELEDDLASFVAELERERILERVGDEPEAGT